MTRIKSINFILQETESTRLNSTTREDTLRDCFPRENRETKYVSSILNISKCLINLVDFHPNRAKLAKHISIRMVSHEDSF